MDDADDSDGSREGERQPRAAPEPQPKNLLTTAPLFWMREPIVLPASDAPPEESTSGDLECVDPRIAEALRGMGVDGLFSVQKAVLDAFKARTVHINLEV